MLAQDQAFRIGLEEAVGVNSEESACTIIRTKAQRSSIEVRDARSAPSIAFTLS